VRYWVWGILESSVDMHSIPWTLVVSCVCFSCLTSLYARELWRTQRTMKRNPDTDTANYGDHNRWWFQLLLLLANGSRAIALVVEIILFIFDYCPDLWVCTVTRCFPNLVFITCYGRLVFYLGQVCAPSTGLNDFSISWRNNLHRFLTRTKVYLILCISLCSGSRIASCIFCMFYPRFLEHAVWWKSLRWSLWHLEY